MKKLSRDQMKKVMGGDVVDKPCSKCCSDSQGTDCSQCRTGISCNGFLKACPQNPDGTCPPE